jgi:hypothetical protein
MEAAQAEIIKSYGKEFSRTFVNKVKGTGSARPDKRICRVIRSISIEIKPAYMIYGKEL